MTEGLVFGSQYEISCLKLTLRCFYLANQYRLFLFNLGSYENSSYPSHIGGKDFGDRNAYNILANLDSLTVIDIFKLIHKFL